LAGAISRHSYLRRSRRFRARLLAIAKAAR
jgi:hypothetical protein